MKELLRSLDSALRRSAPDLYGSLRPGATLPQLADAESALGRPVPDELRQLYAWRDGQTGKGTFPAHGRSLNLGFFLPLARSLERRDQQLDLRGQGALPAEAWDLSWLPLIDGGDGDLLCADLERGAVVEFQHETAARPVVFPSLADWLEEVVAGLERAADSAPEPGAPGVAAYLRERSEPTRSWQELREWVRGLKACGSPAVFARIALALDERPLAAHHPVMRCLIEAVERWLAEPSAARRQGVADALTARSRTFVPRGQVSSAAQHAAEAALADDLGRACDGALHALASAAPGVVDGTAADVEKTCLDLQQSVRAVLGG